MEFTIIKVTYPSRVNFIIKRKKALFSKELKIRDIHPGHGGTIVEPIGTASLHDAKKLVRYLTKINYKKVFIDWRLLDEICDYIGVKYFYAKNVTRISEQPCI